MQPHRTAITALVIETLQDLGEDLKNKDLQSANETTRLFGSRSALDSMNLVNFIADVEERISDEYEIHIILANESAMSRTHSPFRSVSSCIDYIMKLIAQNAE
jgi:acyl carrier protein